MQKNAKQHVVDVQGHLQSAANCLNQALSTVEKPENRQKIQSSLSAVNNALSQTQTTLSTYVE